MYVARYNPTREIEEFRRGFDNLNSFLDNFIGKGSIIKNSDFVPSVNTREGEDAYYIELDLPGIKKEDINIDVNDNVLTVSGERKIKKEDKEDDYYKVESSYGMFERSFTLPENVDADNINAQSQDGVLEVVIPKLKKAEKKPKKIEIK